MATEKLPRPALGFLVKTELRMTPDKGIGVFAAQFIPANTVVYESEPQYYTEEEAAAYLESLPSLQEQQKWLDHAYGSLGKVCMDLFDPVMVNHSDNPTLMDKTSAKGLNTNAATALCDINEGEELTENYRMYSLTPAYVRLCKKYGVCEVYERDDYIR